MVCHSGINIAWSKVSGPGGVVFGNASSAQTTATFSTYGTYVLRLSADDTELTSSDDVQVVIFNSDPVNMAPQVYAGEGSVDHLAFRHGEFVRDGK
jgi:hypothetical protein